MQFWMQMLKSVLPALAAAVLLAISTPQADARNATCRSLEAQLSSLSSGKANSRQVRRYKRAISKQQKQIGIATKRARQRGCSNSFRLFDRGGTNQCHSLRNSIREMRSNLNALNRRLRSMQGGSSRAERRRILARIEANRCRVKKKRNVVRKLPDPIRNARRDETLGQRPGSGQSDGRSVTILSPGSGLRLSGTTFRTLCVRTCDGYYFPMSFSTTEQFFQRDQEACEAMCPGVEVRLFTHRTSDQESEDMLSLMGEPYTALATAFAYRNPDFDKPKGCACNPAKEFVEIGGGSKSLEESEPAPPPLPVTRPDPALDPETASNLAQGLTVSRLISLLNTSSPSDGLTGKPGEQQSRIRVVGPVFLPDPEGAIDLKVPAPSAAQ